MHALLFQGLHSQMQPHLINPFTNQNIIQEVLFPLHNNCFEPLQNNTSF